MLPLENGSSTETVMCKHPLNDESGFQCASTRAAGVESTGRWGLVRLQKTSDIVHFASFCSNTTVLRVGQLLDFSYNNSSPAANT